MSKEIEVFGDTEHGRPDGGQPIKVGGVARRTNPTAVENGDRVDSFHDDVGRQVFWPYQVRDLIATARASITTSGEQTLLSGAASTFHDLVEVSGVNQSTNAVTVSIRDATGGGVVRTLEIPANNTRPITFTVPVPQNVAADTWTAQVDDFVSDGTTSNGTVVVEATFIKNV